MGYVAGEGATAEGAETPRDVTESPRQSVLAQSVEPSFVPLPSEAVNTSANGGARVLVSPGTSTEDAQILPVPLGLRTSRVAEVPSPGPVIIILEEAPAPPSNVP